VAQRNEEEDPCALQSLVLVLVSVTNNPDTSSGGHLLYRVE
jgi:hypothetical protein